MKQFSSWVSQSLDIIIVVHGLGMVVPWNMLINANRYFVNFKLSVGPDSPDALKNYNRNFISYLGVVSRTTNIFFQLVNMLFYRQVFVSVWLRATITLTIELIVFIIFIILVFIEMNHVLFFWLTISLTALLNVANGLYQSLVFGVVVNLPPQYIRSLTFGRDICGIIVSCVNIFSIGISSSPHTEGLIYFSFAVLILSSCLISQAYLNSNEFMRFLVYLRELHIKEQSEKRIIHSDSIVVNEEEETKYVKMFKRIPLELLDLFLVNFVTFSIFPAIEANIRSSDNLIPAKYFEAVFCFLIYNVFAFLGNITAQYIPFPTPPLMIGFVSVRLMFIPFYLLYNYQPKQMTRVLPVLIRSDWLYLAFNMFTAFSGGHLSVLCLRYSHTTAPEKLKTSAGMLASITIMSGMAAGLTFSLLFPEIV